MSNINKVNKICRGENCENTFVVYKSTDKYCSFNCLSKSKDYKPLKRTILNKASLKPRTPLKKQNRKKDSDFEKEFSKAKLKVKKRVVKKYGALCCERCFSQNSIQFSTHHLIYRSERPKHKFLNHLSNLLYLCFDCHEWFHSNKKNRNRWITKNKLWVFFGNIWGYEKENE